MKNQALSAEAVDKLEGEAFGAPSKEKDPIGAELTGHHSSRVTSSGVMASARWAHLSPAQRTAEVARLKEINEVAEGTEGFEPLIQSCRDDLTVSAGDSALRIIKSQKEVDRVLGARNSVSGKVVPFDPAA